MRPPPALVLVARLDAGESPYVMVTAFFGKESACPAKVELPLEKQRYFRDSEVSVEIW